MKIIFILASICFISTQCELPAKIDGYNNAMYSGKSKLPLRTLMIKIRKGPPMMAAMRPNMGQQNSPLMQRLRIPVKLIKIPMMKVVRPQLIMRPLPITKGKIVNSKPFLNSVQGPNSGSYVFENPFQNHVQHSSVQPIENTIKLTDYSGPIHTIPPPNLSSQSSVEQFQPQSDVSYQHSNHLSLTDDQAVAYHHSTITPNQFGHYQVTEETTNDQTLQDPLTGQQKYFAPDPDPSLPTRFISPTVDPFSRPSRPNSLPSDVSSAASLNQQQYFQYVTPVPQQQLPDSYGLPLNNQPQLQQHLQQQAQYMTSMPLSPYNPTYLVQQSNNLFSQHQKQQQLFKPEANFLQGYNTNLANPLDFQPSNSYSSQSGGLQQVASPGQLYQSSQQLQEAQTNYQTITNQEQYSNDPYRASGSQNIVSYTPNSITTDQYRNSPNQFLNSDQAQQTYEFALRQQENENILAQANQDLYDNQILQQQQQYSAPESTSSTQSSSPHNQHQQLLAQQFGNTGLAPLRIVLPDDDQFPQSSNNYQIKQRADEDEYENVSSEKIESGETPAEEEMIEEQEMVGPEEEMEDEEPEEGNETISSDKSK